MKQPRESPLETFVPRGDETFRVMFENAACAVALVDSEGHCLLTNPECRHWLGYSSEELAVMSFVDFTYPDDVATDWELYQELLAGKRQAYTIEKRYYTKERDVVWGRITVSLVAAAPSQPRYAVAVVEDITQLKRAQEEQRAAVAALRESEERLRVATQAGHIGIFDWDLQTGDLTWSGMLEGLFGLTGTGFPKTYEAFQTLIHPDDRLRVVASVTAALESGKQYAEEYRVVRPDGSVCWIAAEGAVFRDADGKPTRMIGTSMDISARQRMLEQREQALHDLGERVKELTALHATAKLLQDADLTTSDLLQCLVDLLPPAWQYPEVTAARATFADTIAATPGFRVTPWMLSVPFHTAEEREGLLEVVYLEPRPDEWQGPFLREELDLLHSLVEMLVAYFERQHHAAMQRRYAQALARAQEEERRHIARELHDSVSQTLYAISLATQTALSAVHEDVLATEEALAYVQELAGTAIADMRALIFELRPQTLEQEGLVAAIERLVGSLVARHRFQILATLGAEPDLDVDKKEAMYRIVQECFNNITRHARANAIGVSLNQANGRVKLEVTDDGVGFAPESGYPGHLGLVSMRERAGAIGAEVSIQSAPGKGTRVIIEVPT